jgi:hypothetical protein
MIDIKAHVRKAIKLADEQGEGVWRTINGAPVFIKEGQSVEDALKEKIAGLEKNIANTKATTPKIYESPAKQAEYNAKHGITTKLPVPKIGQKISALWSTEFKQPVTVHKVKDGSVWVKAKDGKIIGPIAP